MPVWATRHDYFLRDATILSNLKRPFAGGVDDTPLHPVTEVLVPDLRQKKASIETCNHCTDSAGSCLHIKCLL